MDTRAARAEFSNAKYDAAWAIRFYAPAGERARPTAASRHVTHPARTTIVDEGDKATSVYEILEGGVILFKLLSDGRRQIIELLGVGDVFGFVPGQTFDVAAEALTPVRLAVFDRKAAEADSELRDRLFTRLRAQMCALHDHALLLGRKSAQERVATYLLRLVPGYSGIGCIGGKNGSASIKLAMTRQEIGDYLGLTIETVSRAFSSLRRDGVIAYAKQDEVRVPNICRLCRLTGSQ
jgi:CRP-like cAMP-binding protein